MSNGIRTALVFFSVTLAFSLLAANAYGQTDKSLFSEYKGIKIGVATDAVRAKLGSPKDRSDNLDLYTFSNNESVQFYYTAKVVNAIVITYTGDLKGAPLAKDIFGIDVAEKDGMIFKMERYPKAGYWVSYTRTSGNDAMVNIAIQKM